MTPAQYLAKATTAAARSRIYRASEEAREGAFLTLHVAGQYHSLPYTQLRFISGDDRGGTFIKLTFQAVFVVKGRQLLAVSESIRMRRAAHLHAFDGAMHDPPEPGAPVITSIEIETSKNGAA